MRYNLHHCPRCQLRPIEDYDLPDKFPPEGRVATLCKHCGARLWAVVEPSPTGGTARVVFRMREGD